MIALRSFQARCLAKCSESEPLIRSDCLTQTGSESVWRKFDGRTVLETFQIWKSAGNLQIEIIFSLTKNYQHNSGKFFGRQKIHQFDRRSSSNEELLCRIQSAQILGPRSTGLQSNFSKVTFGHFSAKIFTEFFLNIYDFNEISCFQTKHEVHIFHSWKVSSLNSFHFCLKMFESKLSNLNCRNPLSQTSLSVISQKFQPRTTENLKTLNQLVVDKRKQIFNNLVAELLELFLKNWTPNRLDFRSSPLGWCVYQYFVPGYRCPFNGHRPQRSHHLIGQQDLLVRSPISSVQI